MATWRKFSDRFRSGDSPISKRLAEEDSLWSHGTQDSWIELGPPSRGSMTSSCVDAALLIEAQASAKGSRHSPKSLASPCAHNASGPDLLLVNQKLLDGKPEGGAWGLWDWSSRFEATPPKEYVERGLGVNVEVGGSSDLTTPPNSPAPGPDAPFALRHSKLARSEFFRVEVVFGLVMSNLFTFFVGACLGYYISKKVGAPSLEESCTDY